jgi:hypothetical protein
MRKLAIALCSSLLFGCAAGRMSEIPSNLAMVPPPDRALVVFVRPSWLGSALSLSIVDEQGHFVGDSLAESHFAVTTAPGRHHFILWSGNTDVVEADLLPGRTYYVYVDLTLGNDHMYAVSPRDAHWSEVAGWMAKTRRLQSNFTDGERYLEGRRDDVSERVRRGLEHSLNWSPEERAQHTLMPGDGV